MSNLACWKWRFLAPTVGTRTLQWAYTHEQFVDLFSARSGLRLR